MKLGQFLVDRGIALALLAGQLGALQLEAVISEIEQPLLVRRQLEPRVVVQRLDAREQRPVLDDFRRILRQHRRNLALQRAEFRRRKVRAPDAVIGHGAIKTFACALHRLDGVGERGSRRIVRNGVDLGEVRRDAGLDGGLQLREVHLVEGRLPPMLARPFRQQRIGRKLCRRRFIEHRRRNARQVLCRTTGCEQRHGAERRKKKAAHRNPPEIWRADLSGEWQAD